MTTAWDSTNEGTWVAIDVAKAGNAVLVQHGDLRKVRFRVANKRADHDKFVDFLHEQPAPCRVALEPTGNYHRPIAYRLLQEGFEIYLISSVAASRFREAMFNSWDKNDPKDCSVMLEMLRQGLVLHYHDPLVSGVHDLQELSKTYMQVTSARTRLQHSLLTHYLPLYWPEFGRYWHASRSEWFIRFLLRFTTPALVRELSVESFVEEAWDLVGKKVNKAAKLQEIYGLAGNTIALPVEIDSCGVRSFRSQLRHFQALNDLRRELQADAESTLGSDQDYQLLQSIPGIGPVLALVIIAEAGDLRRFGHHRQFLKYCGLDLAKSQSGLKKGTERLSKRGNARLRCAFWMAGAVATRQQENSLRRKYERYIRSAPADRDRRRKALTAISAKMARIAHAVVKTGTPYREFFDLDVPSGSIPINRAVEAIRTS